MTWIETASGIAFDLANPAPEMVNPRDIAHHLALLNRFNGATNIPFSVAQHSVLVLDIVAKSTRLMSDEKIRLAIQRYALLHDAHEAFKGDDSTPKKRTIAKVCAENPIRMIETAIDRAILSRFGLAWPVPQAWKDIIKQADLIALATERRDLMDSRLHWPSLDGVDPWPEIITPWAWMKAEESFFSRLQALIDPAHELKFQAGRALKPKAA